MSHSAWIDVLPAEWRMKPLRYAADCLVSSVDKHIDEDEIPVRLCNYSDVYHREFIRPNDKLVYGTASDEEVERFGLRAEDVVITKDSESWDDIGIPALVTETSTDIVCGYHLAILRPHHDILLGSYLLRCLQTRQISAQLELAATGVTRFGITKLSIGRLSLPLPPLEVQSGIAKYLNEEATKLDLLVLEQQRLLKLMDEKRCALIADAAMRGLDPDVSLRDSGIPWIGHIPAHWDIWKLAHTAIIGNGSTPSRGRSDYWSDVGTPWLNSSVVHMDEATQADQFVTDTALRECHLPMVESGSVLVAITGQGQTRGKATVLTINATINQHLAYITPDAERLDPRYLRWTIFAGYEYLRSISDDTGGTKGALTCEDIANLRVPIPPIHEQRAVSVHIATRLKHLAELYQAVEHVMDLVKERRSALIAAAVMGQIQATKWA